MTVRRLEVADLAAARVVAAEAFGGWPPGQDAPPLPTELPAGRHEWGWFDDGPDGERLVGRASGLAHRVWLGGSQVPSCGIAGVAIAPEHRGRGMLTTLLRATVTEAVGRGDVVSGLYPTAPGIYRSLGWELVTSLDTVELPTAELARLSTPEGVTTRRATTADLDAVRAVYDAWAGAQSGPLTRTGVRFADHDQLLEQVTGVSLAVEQVDGAERVVGYLSWDRGHGYGPDAALTVHDLLATSLDGYRALWAVAGSFASVTGRVRLRTSGDDPARLVLPAMTWDVVERHPYMFRVLDLPGAVAAIDPAVVPGATAEVDLVVTGDRLGLVDGGFVLSLGDGPARCEPGPAVDGAATLTVQGLGLLVSGAQSCANLRLLGHLRHGTPGDDRVLDAAFGTRQVHVRDYF